MSLDHIFIYQDLCPWTYTHQDYVLGLCRTYVLGEILTRTMSLDHIFIYQDLCPWTYTHQDYVLGSYFYLPELMSLDIYLPGLCPCIISIITRTYVLGYILTRPMSLDHIFIYQDLCPWMCTYQDLCPWTYTYQDLCPWIFTYKDYVLGSYF